MKEMEAKTENRYEYRKPQEKRKQMIAPDLFEFAYVPDWYGHLAELERLALPESWKFRKPSRETKNADTPILERYIHTIFRKQVIDFNSESDPRKADSIFHLENECVCFHTGLYTPQYKGIYGYFERNNFSDSLRDWYFRGFCDELSPKLRYIEPLPQKPVYHMAQSGINFNPEWPIRVNVNHILGDEENLERIPAKIRKVKNLPLLFETAVELGRRKSVIEPGLVVPQGYQGRVQYLLPVYLTNMQKPDLAMTLTVMDGYYLGNTCLTLEMAYLNARVVARPMAPWLLPFEDGDVDAVNAAALSGKLLQMANGAVYDENHKVRHIHDKKLDALEDLIEAANGKPVLVAYWYQHDLDRIVERFKAVPLKAAGDIRKWKEGKIPVAAIHPASAGHGLNIQDGGHILIWFGLTWSLELYMQCNARLWRQGQRETVMIYHIINKGTLDEDAMRSLEQKDCGQSAIIDAVKARIGGVNGASRKDD